MSDYAIDLFKIKKIEKEKVVMLKHENGGFRWSG